MVTSMLICRLSQILDSFSFMMFYTQFAINFLFFSCYNKNKGTNSKVEKAKVKPMAAHDAESEDETFDELRWL